MFTKEQKERAVKLYIESGRKAAAVINALGYPSRNMLRYWYQEYINTGKIHHERPSKYTEADRERALSYWRSHNYNRQETIQALGYPKHSALSQWIEKYATEEDRQNCILTRGVIQYSEETKQAAVLSSLVGSKPDYMIAAQGGFSAATLYQWRKKLLREEELKVKKQQKHDLPSDVPALQAEIKEMQEKLHQMQMEYDILHAAIEISKKEGRINPQQMNNAEKAELIDALKEKYRLNDLLCILQLSRSSYFYQKKAQQKTDKYCELRREIKAAFEGNKSCYGYRRIHAKLKTAGRCISEKVIRRIMKSENLKAVSVRQRKYSSYQGEISPEVANVLNRNFHADKPNEKWLTDITEFSLPCGKVYLSPIIDCFDGMPVSWTIGLNPDANLVNQMLDMAIATLGANQKPIVHSDRGCHYRWPGWIERMERSGLTRSMSKKGCSPDNSACEGFFGRLKNEMFYGRRWDGVTLEEFITILDDYIHWYAEERIKKSIGWRSPVQYRQDLGLMP